MGSFFVNLRVLSILSIVLSVLMLTGISCSGGTDGMAAIRKDVSTLYYVSGLVRCDHNDNWYWMDDGDHVVVDWEVLYKIEGDSTVYSTTTDDFGYYSFQRVEDSYVDVWLVPGSYLPDWRYYYLDLGQNTNWGDPNPTIRVPENQNSVVYFIGSDYRRL